VNTAIPLVFLLVGFYKDCLTTGQEKDCSRIADYCYDPILITKPKTFHIQNITTILGQKI
jgi:hypothetical protein